MSRSERFLRNLPEITLLAINDFARTSGAIRFQFGIRGRGHYPNLRLWYPSGAGEDLTGRRFRPSSRLWAEENLSHAIPVV